MNKTFIYGLKEENGEIRYIGKSLDPKKRLRQHKSNARKEKSHKVSWIKYCQNNNIKIEIVILEECESTIWHEREIYWISHFNNLTNHDRGGKGGKPVKYELPYQDCKKWIKQNFPNLNSQNEYNKHMKDFPPFITPYPYTTYRYRGWISWGDFLETGKIQDNILSKNYLSYEEARNWCEENNIKNQKEYKNFEKPYYIPSRPERFYKKRGWIDWHSFIPNYDAKRVGFKKEYPSLIEIKKWCEENNIKNCRTYYKERPDSFPSTPQIIYKNNGWVSWNNFLNK